MLILLFEIYLLTLKNLHVLNFFWKNQLHSLKFLTEYSNLKFYNNNQLSTNCISLSRITRLSNWSRELFLLFLDSPVNWRKFHTGRGNTSMKFHRWTRTCITIFLIVSLAGYIARRPINWRTRYFPPFFHKTKWTCRAWSDWIIAENIWSTWPS